MSREKSLIVQEIRKDTLSLATEPLAAGTSAHTLSPADKLEMYYWMLLARAVDDRCHSLFKQGRLPGTIFSQMGHEAISVASAMTLGKGDAIAPMHRDLGAYLVRGITPTQVFAQHMARVSSPSKGRDNNTHGLTDTKLRIFGFVSHLPQSMPVALGAAMAFQYRGEENVAMTYFGDGSSSEGGWHETLNMAAVFKAPIVFILENNQFAFSTPTEHQYAIKDLADRASGYGMPGVVIDGNDAVAVWDATRCAVEHARRGKGPTLIECKTMRMRGHAIHDPASYVPEELLEEWRAKCPILRMTRRLSDEGLLNDDSQKSIQGRIQKEIDAAVETAESSDLPDPDTLMDGVFA